jgi:cold shock CspA family protein
MGLLNSLVEMMCLFIFTGITGDGFKSLRAGDEVEFEISNGQKGPQATNVVKAK